jgi:hypothetical protein
MNRCEWTLVIVGLMLSGIALAVLSGSEPAVLRPEYWGGILIGTASTIWTFTPWKRR